MKYFCCNDLLFFVCLLKIKQGKMIIRFCIKGSWFHRITKRFKLDGKITSLHNWAKQSLPMANRIQCSAILLPDRERACTTSRKKPENLVKVLSMQRSYCFILSYNASIANYMILLQRLVWSIVAEHSVSAIGQRYSLKTPFITLNVNSQSINTYFYLSMSILVQSVTMFRQRLTWLKTIGWFWVFVLRS